MSTLLLKFTVVLHQYEIEDFYQHHGPLFHRWLPDGEDDAIILDTDGSDFELKFWFERSGFLEEWNNLIKFDYKRREVASELITKQAILDAGPLRGVMKIEGISGEQISVLRENKIGDENYVKLGERIVKLLVPLIVKVLSILRTNYGQYWIREIESWDSRESSLGYYCKSILHLKYSLDNGNSWEDFIPDQSIANANVTIIIPSRQTFSQYLTRSDWQELEKTLNSQYEPSLAATTLVRTHQLLDQGNIRQAFIEGITALELAIGDFFRERLSENKQLLKNMDSFWNLPLRAQFISLSTAFGDISIDDMEYTLRAIKIRNEIVHDGKEPSKDSQVGLRRLLFTVGRLISGPSFKFPSAKTGNNISMPEEKWDKLS